MTKQLNKRQKRNLAIISLFIACFTTMLLVVAFSSNELRSLFNSPGTVNPYIILVLFFIYFSICIGIFIATYIFLIAMEKRS
ncbi:MAG: hypothetical protein ACFFDF_04575 [Candidatus Odinarchaeota archaeon]